MPTLATIARNAAVDAVAALLNSGDIRFETSGNAQVALCGFGATAFGSAATGSATANAISDDSDADGGTVDHAVLRKSDTSEVMECTCGTSGSDINLSSLTIGAGDTVKVTSFTLSQAAS